MGLVDEAVVVRIYVYDHLKDMGELLSALRTHKWQKTQLRYNIVPPEDRETKVYKSGNKMTTIKKGVYSQSLKSGILYELIIALAPKRPDGDWRITINKNTQCYPHQDRGNLGTSYIMFLGDYEGGDLCFENGRIVSERDKWHEIDGSVTHWNTPITSGIKYSIILFNKAPSARYGIKN